MIIRFFYFALLSSFFGSCVDMQFLEKNKKSIQEAASETQTSSSQKKNKKNNSNEDVEVDENKRSQKAVLVELFTSQSCSSCPPADALLKEFVEKNDNEEINIVALAFHVDYWNHLHWEDEFSKKEYSDRQRNYMRSFGASNVYTPSFIVHGQSHNYWTISEGAQEALNEIKRQAEAISPLDIELEIEKKEQTEVEVSFEIKSKISESYEVLLALVDEELSTDVTAGENRGRKLVNVQIVKDMVIKAASPESGKHTFDLNKLDDLEGAEIAIVVQGSDKKVLGVMKIELN